MPVFANTPESQMGRSDSKNPSTTCRGITSSGRPCRRPITAGNTPALSTRLKPVKLRVDDPRDENLYCWQHKEQASLSARSSPGPRGSSTPILEERTSLDTLADRLGLVAQATQSEKLSNKPGRPSAASGGRPPHQARPKPKKELEFCCCFRIPIEEVSPPPRPKPRPLQPTVSATPPSKMGGKKPSRQHLAPASSPSRPSYSGHSSGRASHASSTVSSSSRTAQYMSLIPASASPQTASLLLAELAKPISQQDDAGYIYMFWLTPDSAPADQPAEVARSLLAPPSTPTRPGNRRRPSDVLASFAAMTDGPATRGLGGPGSGKDSKILLKIGRATNVQRRLNEWTRQCGYNLSLIRYYPYVPSGSPAASVRKVPHSHKVERLIHLELAGLGMRVADREKCDACGREHREWFEVTPSRKGVADVDDLIRRWVDWDEAQV
ncbi:DUF1766-domain-containing protein [Thozetella sp. PMI_491]|nr:DUF1766-domain-containing protein [Thozetella sp. PMI_491]